MVNTLGLLSSIFASIIIIKIVIIFVTLLFIIFFSFKDSVSGLCPQRPLLFHQLLQRNFLFEVVIENWRGLLTVKVGQHPAENSRNLSLFILRLLRFGLSLFTSILCVLLLTNHSYQTPTTLSFELFLFVSTGDENLTSVVSF